MIFQNVGRCPHWHYCIFCHFKAPMDSPLLFHTRISLGKLCFYSRSGCLQIETLSSAVLLPLTLNTVHDRSVLILHCSQHPLVIVKVILHNNPPLSCLPHTSHEGFQREVQVNLFSLLYILYFLYYFVLFNSIVIIFIWMFLSDGTNHLSFHYFLWGNSLW